MVVSVSRVREETPRQTNPECEVNITLAQKNDSGYNQSLKTATTMYENDSTNCSS